MLQYDFEESIGFWVTSASHAIRRALDTELAREEITFRQFEVLAWLALKGEQSQVELADRMGVEAPTLAGILSRMERDGWLDRYGCPDDRRKKRIRATPKSEAVWSRMVECCHRIREQAATGLDTQQTELLKAMCRTICENLGHDHHIPASAGAESPGGCGETSSEVASADDQSDVVPTKASARPVTPPATPATG